MYTSAWRVFVSCSALCIAAAGLRRDHDHCNGLRCKERAGQSILPPAPTAPLGSWGGRQGIGAVPVTTTTPTTTTFTPPSLEPGVPVCGSWEEDLFLFDDACEMQVFNCMTERSEYDWCSGCRRATTRR